MYRSVTNYNMNTVSYSVIDLDLVIVYYTERNFTHLLVKSSSHITQSLFVELFSLQ